MWHNCGQDTRSPARRATRLPSTRSQNGSDDGPSPIARHPHTHWRSHQSEGVS
jgi:hypothetical protein